MLQGLGNQLGLDLAERPGREKCRVLPGRLLLSSLMIRSTPLVSSYKPVLSSGFSHSCHIIDFSYFYFLLCFFFFFCLFVFLFLPFYHLIPFDRLVIIYLFKVLSFFFSLLTFVSGHPEASISGGSSHAGGLWPSLPPHFAGAISSGAPSCCEMQTCCS